MPIWRRTPRSEEPPLTRPDGSWNGAPREHDTQTGAPLLALEDVSAGYRGVPVVHGVSLAVNAGEISLVVGPNGAGKSTLVKSVIGELPLLAGTITFDGDDVSRWGEERRSVGGLGYVPQVRDVFPTLTVVENLEVGAYRLPSRKAKLAIREMLERFPQLEQLKHRKGRQLSGGERKLLAIARGLIANPKLLILDEPTANLAPKIARMVLDDVVVGLAETGHGILLIEQRVALASRVAARVTVLVDGKVRYAGSGEDFRALPDVGALFFGSEPDARRDEGALRTP
jgi:ABC-type branched-subunit amino acid transport system ATPase component